jgi:hypothetical protein
MFKFINFEFNFNFKFLNKLFKIFKKKITKENANILFIDDEKFPVVENLEKAGWSVKRIKDLENPQDEEVKRAHVIFVDYKGVGKILSNTEEGIGVVKLLKNTYHNSKRVILYSVCNQFSLGPHLNIADGQMPKNSDTYEFIKMIESELKKIR